MEKNYQKLAGKKLAELIKRDYITREEFAFQRGYSERTITRYVNEGINKINIIQEFAMLFNVGFEYFLTD